MNKKKCYTLLLRDEYKQFEKRCVLSPTVAKKLNDMPKFKVLISHSTTRIYSDDDYKKLGLNVVPRLYWVTNPESMDCVIGLKELPEAGEVIDGITVPFKLVHCHIFFAHCFKGQEGCKKAILRFVEGKGEIIDLEFLQDMETKRRAVGMGKSAGFSGCGVGLLTYFNYIKEDTKLGWYRRKDFVDLIKKQIELHNDKKPKILILGYKGRVGSGCVAFCKEAGIKEDQMILWDLEETKRGGPFIELLTDVDILCNCIYLTVKINPFITLELIEKVKKSKNLEMRLEVFVDISCDVTNEYNPFPINKDITTLDKPIRMMEGIKICAIDHLPTLIPKEATDQFAEGMLKLFPHFLSAEEQTLDRLPSTPQQGCWMYARQIFGKVSSTMVDL